MKAKIFKSWQIRNRVNDYSTINRIFFFNLNSLNFQRLQKDLIETTKSPYVTRKPVQQVINNTKEEMFKNLIQCKSRNPGTRVQYCFVFIFFWSKSIQELEITSYYYFEFSKVFLADSDDQTIILESFEIPSVTRDPQESLLVQIGPEIPDFSEDFAIEESFGNDVARKDIDQRKSDTNLMIPEIIRVPQELSTATSTSKTTSSTTSSTTSTSTTSTTR